VTIFLPSTVLFHQTIEQRLLESAPHPLELQWLKILNFPAIGVESIRTGAGRALFASGLCRT
jgi:hypothetical protein